MPVNLAHHLKLSRCGIFYFRMRVPPALRPAIGKREILQSLRTRNPATARRLAYSFASKTYALFEKMAYPKNFNLPDGSTLSTVDTSSFSTYKAKIGPIEIETDGSDEDHRRVQEMLKVLPASAFTPAPAPAAPAPAPAQYIEPPPAHKISLGNAAVAYAMLAIVAIAGPAISQFLKHPLATLGNCLPLVLMLLVSIMFYSSIHNAASQT
jgi:hypothetical protein